MHSATFFTDANSASITPPPNGAVLRQARDRFAALLDKETTELEWQRFFAECPYILSESLPLRLEPQDIIPVGRPGYSEPDFIFYPRRQAFPNPYGIIELKRPDTRILNVPRKNVLTLARDVHTAVAQANLYATQLQRELITHLDQVMMIGNRHHIFIILGMSSEIARKVTTDILKSQFERLLPPGTSLIPYDSLLQLFESRVPPAIHFVVPLVPIEFVTRGSMRVKVNPILEPVRKHSWESRSVFNPGAVRLQKETHILYGAVGEDDISRIGLAISHDGVQITERLEEPIFEPKGKSEQKGCEDPRLTLISDRIYMLYTAYSGLVSQIALASIGVDDFLNRRWGAWRRHGLVFPGFQNKGAILFPQRFGGKYAIYHCVSPHIWLSFSARLSVPWSRKEHMIFMASRSGTRWDGSEIVCGAPPIKTKHGWLLVYNGSDFTGTWRLGVALVALDDPAKLLHRSANFVLEPQEGFEVSEEIGQVTSGVFSCGIMPRVDKEWLDGDDEVLVYYGGAHTAIGVAIVKISSLFQDEVLEV